MTKMTSHSASLFRAAWHCSGKLALCSCSTHNTALVQIVWYATLLEEHARFIRKRAQFFQSLQAYVHRVGRTGRAGQAGTAITLFADKDEPLRQELAQELGHKSASASEGADQYLNLR